MPPPDERFDPDALDPTDPFEFDFGNRPHLFKHGTFSDEDVWEVWENDPVFLEPSNQTGDADWLMVAQVAGQILVVALAKANSGDPTKARPIGLDIARDKDLVKRYFEER